METLSVGVKMMRVVLRERVMRVMRIVIILIKLIKVITWVVISNVIVSVGKITFITISMMLDNMWIGVAIINVVTEIVTGATELLESHGLCGGDKAGCKLFHRG